MSVLDLFASALGGFIMIAVILFPSYMADQKLSAEIVMLEESRTALAEELSKREKALADKDVEIESQKEKIEDQDEELRKKGEELDNANNALAEAAVLKAEMDEEVEALRLEIARTFLIVSIEWDAVGADVDLSVTDPRGRKYYFAQSNRNGNDFKDEPGAGTEAPDAGTPAAPAELSGVDANWAELSFDNRTGPGLELWQAPLVSPGEYVVTYTLFGTQAGAESTVAVRGKLFYRNGRQELPVEELSNRRNEVTIKVRVTEEGTLELI